MDESNMPPRPFSGMEPAMSKKIKAVLLITGFLAVVFGGVGLASYSGISPFGEREPVTIGILQYVSALDQMVDGLKAGMKELGYEEGVDVFYDYQDSKGNVDEAKRITTDFLAKEVDLIFTMTTAATKAALDVTTQLGKDTPIVFGQSNVTQKAGIIASYESSGNNVTGVENVNADFIEKELDFLKRINPNAKKVGIFSLIPPYQQPVTKDSVDAVKRLAPQFGLEVVQYDVTVPPGPGSKTQIQETVNRIKPGEIDAIIHLSDPALNFQDTPMIFIAAQKRLSIPFMAIVVPHVNQGALLSYGSNFVEQGKQAAVIVDKVLRGTNPSDIPIEFSKHTVIAVNLKTAQELGITIPDPILSIANIKVQ